jgi:hypothetical protein
VAGGRETAAVIPSARARETARAPAGNRAQADSRIEVSSAANASRITKLDSVLPDSVLMGAAVSCMPGGTAALFGPLKPGPHGQACPASRALETFGYAIKFEASA